MPNITQLESHRRWVAKNRERRRAQQRRWYENNAERISEQNKLRSKERVEANRLYYEKHPEKLRIRDLKHYHRISWDDYVAILEAQGGLCAICRSSESDVKHSRFCVDHCHSTGKIRGLLCGRCNRMLGNAKDNEAVLIAGAKYLSDRR